MSDRCPVRVQGLGAFMMGVLAVIARQQSMRKVMLTVIAANDAAVRPLVVSCDSTCTFCAMLPRGLCLDRHA